MKLSQSILGFSSYFEFEAQYAPLSPYGRAVRDARSFMSSRHELEVEYDRIDMAIEFLRTHEEKVDAVRYALQRISLLPSFSQSIFYAADIFLVKKFVVNFFKVAALLPRRTALFFRVEFEIRELRDLLGESDIEDGDETFYLTERYSSELAAVRKELRRVDELEKRTRRNLVELVLQDTGLDFRCREFLVFNAEKARLLEKSRFVLEPFDSHNFVVRLVLTDEILALAAERDALLLRERAAEEQVYQAISAKIIDHVPFLKAYAEAVAAFDVALAKAQLAIDFGMVRPVLLPSESARQIFVREGRFLPLVWRCDREDLRYWPLELEVSKRANIVFGSNMGGKTVVLKSLSFFQVLAQMGFFVPADEFETKVFSDLAYVGALIPAFGSSESGALAERSEEGLSGFGQEIHDFSKEWKSSQTPKLIFVDEFARTTNSVEASALVGAVLHALAASEERVGIVSSHFMDIKGLSKSECGFFRMKGLSRKAFEEFYLKGAQGSLAERLQRVNRFMEYQVVVEKELVAVRDALSIAEALGLPSEILGYARRALGE
jgi:DNA mismatch repair ATPase MutS